MTTTTLRLVLAIIFFALVIPHNSISKNIEVSSQKLYFIENKGQITDQHNNTRNDIQYAVHAPGMNIFIGNGQIHYQFTKLTTPNAGLKQAPGKTNVFENQASEDTRSTITTYRMDVELAGANIHAPVIMTEPLAYYENYFLADHEKSVQAHTCQKIIYENIYKGIDWVIYIRDNKLEHEFVIRAGGNAADIRLKYHGQTSLEVNDEGSIIATTPMGTITEHAPICFDANGAAIPSHFRLNKNVLSYSLPQSSEITIDPTLEWGTYYGPNSNNTSEYSAVCDHSGYIYSCGLTYSPTTGNVATTGSYQATYGGECDGYLIKFDSSGNRIWGTYYGGPSGDWATGIALDAANNIYISGSTSSTSGIATAGAQQTTYGGGLWDAFIAKFNSSGALQWGTYAGGTAIDYGNSVACDTMGDVYLGGVTDSYSGLVTPGSFMTTHASGHDNFVIQYNATTGLRQWGTYLGGNSNNLGGMVACDGYYLYLAGTTSSTTDIAAGGGIHQAFFGGATDVFLEKFYPNCTRQWGTYFGGNAAETIGGVACDNVGGLYLLGTTNSDTLIASPGCYQPLRSGMQDAFLAAFDNEGSTIWSTYYGGPDQEDMAQGTVSCDNLGNVFITGYTASTSGIASLTGAWQSTYGGGDDDAFFAKYNYGGTQIWSTYYGGSAYDQGNACAFDGANVYLVGETSSPDSIATPGSFLSSGGSGPYYYQGFLAKFHLTDTLPTLHTATLHSNPERLSIYPNPNSGSFTIVGTIPGCNGLAQLSISDMAGRTLMTDNVNITNGNVHQQINLHSFTQGVYVLKIVSQNNINTLPFVIK